MNRPNAHSTPNEVWAYVEYLEQEVDRMSSGRLTEQEFQNLCHEQGEDCPLRFAEGCVKYNRELFGDKSRLDLLPQRGACGIRYHHESCDCGGVGGER